MKFFGWIGYQCSEAFFYVIDLTCFLLRALSVWQPHRKIINRAVYSVFLDQLILNGINAIAIISFLAVVVGISIASQLVFIIVSVTGAKDFVEILSRLILSEIGPLITSVVLVGRSCTGIVVDLGNTKVAGELEPLHYSGINIDDYVVLPRIVCMVISQVILALYFSAIMLMFGVIFSLLIYEISAQESLTELLNLVTTDSLFGFMLKNVCFGLIIGTVACFHGLLVNNASIHVSEQMQKAVVRCLVFLFLVDSYFIVFTL